MKYPTRPVAELCSLAIDCVNKTAPTVEYETPFKMIRTTNVKRGFIDLDQVKYVTEETFQKWTRRSRLQYGDVILSREAPVGEVGRFTSRDEGVFLGQRLFQYRADPDLLDWNYLAFVLQSHEVQGRLHGMGFGATVHHIRVGDAQSLEIPCPPLRIQRRIGGVLAAYDDLIENNRRRIALLEEAARQLYREWFIRLRFPGHEHTRTINGIPEGWKRSRLEDLALLLSTGIAPRYDDSADGLVINQRCVRDGRLDITRARHQAREFNPKLQIRPGDVLVNSTGEGTLGRVAQVMDVHPNCTVDTHVTIVRPQTAVGFHFFGLTMGDWAPRLATMGRGATNQTGLSRSQIGSIEITVPQHGLIRRFEEIVDPMARQAANLGGANLRLRTGRDLLLPHLVSGEVRV